MVFHNVTATESRTAIFSSLALEHGGERSALHVGAENHHGVAAIRRHRTDHVGDRGGGNFAEGEIVA